jgi:hypothetical protein
MDGKKVVNMYVLGPYVLTFDAAIKVEYFSCESYNGVMFTVGDKKYQVVNNYYMGPRLIINPLAGGFEDIPFKPGTFWLLPEGATAEELSKEQFAHVAFTR